MKPTPVMVERAAEAIANARGMRRGVPPIVGILQALPEKLRTECLADAESALVAAGMPTLKEAAEEGLATLVAVGAHIAPNGQPWADCGVVWKALLALRNALANVEGRPAIQAPKPEFEGEPKL